MGQIDWPGLARSALWILGLGAVLAALSYASWHASGRGEGLWQALSGPPFLVPASAGLFLVTVSLALGATPLWQRAVWTLASAVLAWHTYELVRREPSE